MTGKQRANAALRPLLPLAGIVWLVNRLGQSHLLVDGFTRFMNSPRQKRKAFAGYSPGADDVVVATCAKSGTNWTMQIALQIAYRGEAEYDFIHELVPWLDAPLPIVMAKLRDTAVARRAPTGLRVIKTHWEQPYVPYSPQAKYIVIVRDPKEVFMSGYYFAQSMFGSIIDFEYSADEWVDFFLSDRFIFGSWAAHTASWWPYRDRAKVLLVTFGEMRRDSRAMIERIADLMGVALTPVELERVVEKSSFAYMKAHEDQFVPTLSMIGMTRPLGTLIRSGRAGEADELIQDKGRQFEGPGRASWGERGG